MDREKNLIINQLLNPNLEQVIDTLKINKILKNSEIALKARLEGNKLYGSKLHTTELHGEIFSLYTKSIAFAPVNSEELALGYNNRSVLLLHLKKYAESLQDIEKSLFITSANSLKVKLLCRKVEVLTALGYSENHTTFEEAKKHFERIPVSHNDKINLTKVMNRASLILHVNETRATQVKILKGEFSKSLVEKENIFDNVDIKYSQKFGRHLVASHNFKPGDIVYVEKPYAVCSNRDMPYFYCYHCLNFSWTGVPCNFCNWCIYCSEKCKEEAWKKYHDIECLIIPHAKSVLENKENYFWLAIKVLIMAVKEAGSIEKLKKELKTFDDCKDEHVLQNLLKNESLENFKTIYILCDNVSKQYLKLNIKTSGQILACMVKYTPFFGTNLLKNQKLSDIATYENVIFIGALLLKVFNIVCCNKYSISGSFYKFCGSKYPFKCLKKKCSCCKGIFLLQKSSFINNSCVPNVKRCFVGNNKIVIYALQPIRKNSQIFTNYLWSFYEESKNDRKIALQKEFSFSCNCVACERNWPTLNTLSKGPAEQDISLTYAKTSLIEKDLLERYRGLIKTTQEDGSKIDELAIASLAKGIEEADKLLIQPNTTMCILIKTLQIYFEKLYGYESFFEVIKTADLQRNLEHFFEHVNKNSILSVIENFHCK